MTMKGKKTRSRKKEKVAAMAIAIIILFTCRVVIGVERERGTRLVDVVALDRVLQDGVGLHHGSRRRR